MGFKQGRLEQMPYKKRFPAMGDSVVTEIVRLIGLAILDGEEDV